MPERTQSPDVIPVGMSEIKTVRASAERAKSSDGPTLAAGIEVGTPLMAELG